MNAGRSQVRLDTSLRTGWWKAVWTSLVLVYQWQRDWSELSGLGWEVGLRGGCSRIGLGL